MSELHWIVLGGFMAAMLLSGPADAQAANTAVRVERLDDGPIITPQSHPTVGRWARNRPLAGDPGC